MGNLTRPKPPEVHVCLVSDQPIPNLTPLLDPEFRPQRAVLVVSDRMRTQAEWIEAVVRDRGVRCEFYRLSDPWDYHQVLCEMRELLERELDVVERRHIALNLTGGTKLMSLAAHAAFREWDLPFFYVHPGKDQVLWLHEPDLPRHDLADKIKIEPFLQAHGASVTKPPRRNVPEPDDLRLAEALVDEVDRYSGALGTVNWLASQAKGRLWAALDHRSLSDSRVRDLLGVFERHGKLRVVGGRVVFTDEDARFLVNGGWIESWVFDQVRRIRHDDDSIQDAAYGVEVARWQQNKPVFNEFDVVCLRNNRLHLIECKTRRLNEKGEDSPAAGAVYKLDALTDVVGGLRARSMLVSYRALEDYEHRRAESLDVKVCDGRKLRDIDRYLREFLR